MLKTQICVTRPQCVNCNNHAVIKGQHFLNHAYNYEILPFYCGPRSSVGISTGYVLDSAGIESRWGSRFSAPVQTGPGAHPASCTMGTGSFPGVKSGRGVTLTPHPLLVPMVMKEYSYISTPPMGRTACTEPQCLYKSDLSLTLLFIVLWLQ